MRLVGRIQHCGSTLQAIALAVAVFDIYQHPEAILKRYLLHLGISYLSTECIRHGCQAHFNEFINGALCSYSSLPPVVICAPCKRVAVLFWFCMRAGCRLFVRHLHLVAPGIKDVFDTLIAGSSRKGERFPAGCF